MFSFILARISLFGTDSLELCAPQGFARATLHSRSKNLGDSVPPWTRSRKSGRFPQRTLLGPIPAELIPKLRPVERKPFLTKRMNMFAVLFGGPFEKSATLFENAAIVTVIKI